MALVDYREDTEANVDTWEVMDQQRADNPGNFVVPDGASYLSLIEFFAAPDFGTAAAILRLATALRLQGNGLVTDQKPFYFVGPCGGVSMTTTGMVLAYSPPARIPVNIRVSPGQEIEAAFKFVGEDSGDVTGLCKLTYNGPTVSPALKAAQVREADLANATEALVSLNTDVAEGTPTAHFRPPAGVGELFALDIGVGLDVAVATRFAHQVEVDGDALDLTTRPQRFPAWCGYQALVTSTGNGFVAPPERNILQFPLKAGRRGTSGDLIVRAGMIEDDYGAGTIIAGALYV